MKTVRIMLLVGSNGKATACTEGDLGWGDLADNIMDWDGKKATDPDAAARYIVKVSVKEPTVEEIDGVAVFAAEAS